VDPEDQNLLLYPGTPTFTNSSTSLLKNVNITLKSVPFTSVIWIVSTCFRPHALETASQNYGIYMHLMNVPII
jgi:hypothetical protein